MLRRIRDFFRPSANRHLQASPDEHAAFAVLYEGLKVGELFLDGEDWRFSYSDAFRAQSGNAVHALADFPDVYKTYTSKELWPFFQARIPSVEQPAVQAQIETRGIDRRSAAQLLRAFGERSIANQFLVKSA